MTPQSAQPVEVQISTSEYKISPLKKAARELLGYPHPRRVPRGVYVEQAIGISTDEFTRAKDSGVRYLRNVFPLIELGWDRDRCADYLAERGFGKTVKSACVGCPFHGNAGWRWIRDNDPDGWAEAVDFDKAIRDGYPRATEQGQPLRAVLPAPLLSATRRSQPRPAHRRGDEAAPAVGYRLLGGGRGRPGWLLAVVVPLRHRCRPGTCGMTTPQRPLRLGLAHQASRVSSSYRRRRQRRDSPEPPATGEVVAHHQMRASTRSRIAPAPGERAYPACHLCPTRALDHEHLASGHRRLAARPTRSQP